MLLFFINMPGKDISAAKKAEICGMIQLRTHSNRQIAMMSGVSRHTVDRLSKDGKTIASRAGRCGSKASTTASQDRLLLRNLRSNPLSSAAQLRDQWQAVGVTASLSTVQRRLRKMQCRAVMPRRVPKLTEAMKRKRLAFARAHQDWSSDKWSLVAFSDESLFECKAAEKRKVWHHIGSPIPIRQNVKHPTKVMVWAMMSTRGPGRLHIVEGMMNARQYLDVLQRRALPQLREWSEGGEEFIFMHDGAPCHTARVIKQYLAAENVRVLDWPGNSPDLNPLENMWSILKQRLAAETITTKQQLISALIRHWLRDATVTEMCQRMIQSMPRRVQAVIDAKGGHTKY